jgi:hypothetical protein
LVFVCLLPKAFPFLHFDEIDILISSKWRGGVNLFKLQNTKFCL